MLIQNDKNLVDNLKKVTNRFSNAMRLLGILSIIISIKCVSEYFESRDGFDLFLAITLFVNYCFSLFVFPNIASIIIGADYDITPPQHVMDKVQKMNLDNYDYLISKYEGDFYLVVLSSHPNEIKNRSFLSHLSISTVQIIK